jgi:hypothetical protein
LYGRSVLVHDKRRLPELECVLHPPQRAVRVRQVHVTRELVERLQLLDGVALDPHPHRLAHDGVQVDEPAAPEQAVQLALAGGVTAHQLLERRRLVRREVIDMHVGMPVEAVDDEVHHLLEGHPLLVCRERPPVVILGVAPGIHSRDAEQVLAATVVGERVAFEIEKHIPG